MAMKFRAHDTFFIRRGWLSKGMKYVDKKPDVFIDKEENPMDVLGIGSNMVKALRYWMQAVGLTEEPNKGRREQSLTEFGKSVFKYDRYIEETGTIYLLHYLLVSNKKLATAWYYFFNEFLMTEFTKEEFVVALQNYIKKEGEAPVAVRSLGDDFDCIINTYVPKINPKKASPENNIDCPFGELGLIDILDKSKSKKIYKKSKPLVDGLDPWIVLAVIADQSKGRNEISINELLTGSRNVGRIFNLDAISMLELLNKIEKTGEIKIIRTAGLDIVEICNEPTFQKCVNVYYENIDKVS